MNNSEKKSLDLENYFVVREDLHLLLLQQKLVIQNIKSFINGQMIMIWIHVIPIVEIYARIMKKV